MTPENRQPLTVASLRESLKRQDALLPEEMKEAYPLQAFPDHFFSALRKIIPERTWVAVMVTDVDDHANIREGRVVVQSDTREGFQQEIDAFREQNPTLHGILRVPPNS